MQAVFFTTEPQGIPVSNYESESRSVVSDSLRPRGLYSPWKSPGQNTGVGSLSLLQGIFSTQGLNPGLLHCRQILYQLSYFVKSKNMDLPNPGIELGSPALQADSLPTELSGKPLSNYKETSLVVQWLRFCASNAGGAGSSPGRGTKIPHAVQHGQKKKKKSNYTPEKNV